MIDTFTLYWIFDLGAGGNSGIVKGIEYLLIAAFLAVILWLVRLQPRKVGRRKIRKRR
jgi:hypothetical protein